MDDVIFDFGEKTERISKPVPVSKSYEFGGKGKKQCQNSECAVFVGVRTKNCPKCNSEFKKNVEQKIIPSATAESEPEKFPGERVVVRTTKDYDRIVHTPSGVCPIRFEPTTLTSESIIKWAQTVRDWALDSKRNYLTSEAIIYYSRYTVGMNTDEYNMISDTINEWDRRSGIR